MKKTILGATIGAGLFLAAIMPAFASTDCENSWTGAYSNNYCEILAKKKARVRLYNTATIVNTINTLGNTGNNTQNMNTGAGNLLTGSADALADVANTANENDVRVDQCCDTCNCSGGVGSNENTGYASNNTVNIDKRKSVKIRIENTATVINTLNTVANTGHNTQDLNTHAGDVTTGNALVTSIVGTTVNSNTVHVSQ